MLSAISRRLTYSTAILYALLGAVLFVAPVQVSAHFAWKVSAFVTMTIGAWCLGNAWLAWVTARRWQWWLTRTALIYLWLFGILETAVLIAFRDKLQLGDPIAWLYLATLSVNTLTAAWGVSDWIRMRPSLIGSGEKMTGTLRTLTLGFIIFVMGIGIYGLLVRMGSRGTNGTVFPEVMSPFTLRSFAVFYLSLSLSAIPLLWASSRDTLLHQAYAFYGLVVVIITVATLVYIGLFNFTEHPFGLLYLGAYLLVGSVAGFILLRYGTGTRSPRHGRQR